MPMISQSQRAALQLRSVVKREGELEVSLVSVETPRPEADQVVIRVDAAPINPSDLGMLFSAADLSTAKVGGTPERTGNLKCTPPDDQRHEAHADGRAIGIAT